MDEPHFYKLREDDVTDERRQQDGPEKQRQWNKREHWRQWRVRQRKTEIAMMTKVVSVSAVLARA